MHLSNQFTVIDAQGERHTVSAWRAMTQRSTVAGIEFVPVIAQYKIDDWHSIERIDDTTFRTASGEVLRRLSEPQVGAWHLAESRGRSQGLGIAAMGVARRSSCGDGKVSSC